MPMLIYRTLIEKEQLTRTLFHVGQPGPAISHHGSYLTLEEEEEEGGGIHNEVNDPGE